MKTLMTLLLLPLLAFSSQAEILTLEWEDLRPESERNQVLIPLNPHIGDPFGSSMEQSDPWAQVFSPVVPELAGKEIRIAGFVVPLEGDDTIVTEFLLVPYFGACVHVPPPPTNQLIYVKYEQGIPMDIIWDAIWITGKLNTAQYTLEDFSAGYTLNAKSAYLYDEN